MNKTMKLLTTAGVAGIAALAVALGGSPTGIHPPVMVPTAAVTLPHHMPLRPALPKACAKVPTSLKIDCWTLYNRKAESHTDPDGTRIDNPAGPVLVRECTSQYTDYDELKVCLTQPHI